MGRFADNPKVQVFTFRTDAETADLILKASTGYRTISDFLLEAAKGKALAEMEVCHEG